MRCLWICIQAVDMWTIAEQRNCPHTHSYCDDDYLTLRKEEDVPVRFSFDLTIFFRFDFHLT